MSRFFLTLLLTLFAVQITYGQTISGPFMGLEPSGQPQLLAPDLLMTARVEFNGTFSADGKVFYYTSDTPGRGVIAVTTMGADGSWSEPLVASFSGTYSDYDPMFSADGRRLYFSSRRPLQAGGRPQSRVWYMDWNGGALSSPVALELTEREDYFSSTTIDGTLYFNTWSDGSIYLSELGDDGKHAEAKSVGEAINSIGDVGDPFVAPNENYLIFRGYGPDSLGRGDLYISFQTEQGWGTPINLGAPINSDANEMCPYVTPDGKTLIFASNRLKQPYQSPPGSPVSALDAKFTSADNGEQNIYYVSTRFLKDLEP